jgi:hypothetical protein
MGYTIKNNTKVAIKVESTEGTYAPPSTGADYVQVLADGLEMSPSRETLERNVLGTGLGKITPRLGLKSVSGSIPVYMKAGSTAGAAPEYGPMMESVFGSKRSSALITSGTSHTTSLIKVASTANLKVGDIVVVKEDGAFHTSPIVAVVANTSIELLVPMASAPANGVEIEAFTTYVMADTGHPALSISKYVEDAVLESAMGCKGTSMGLENFTTGQIATFNFGFEGLDFGRSLTAPAGGTPVYDASETPVVLKACIYQDGNEISVNEFSFSVENTLGYIQDTCDGKTASRVTARTISGSINPYKLNNSVDQFNRFNTNAPFSLFVKSQNPTVVDGEYKESVSFYFPHCVITELAEADNDGVLQDAISFSANTSDGSLGELYISVS